MHANTYEDDDFEEYTSDSFEEYSEEESESRAHSLEKEHIIRKKLSLESFVAYCHKYDQDNKPNNTVKIKLKHCQTDSIVKKEVQIQCDDDYATTLDKVIMACKNKDYKQLWNIKHNISENKKGKMKPFMNSSSFPLFLEEATMILEAELQIPNDTISDQRYIEGNRFNLTNRDKHKYSSEDNSSIKNYCSWKKIISNKKIIQLLGSISLENQSAVITVHIDINELDNEFNENFKSRYKGCICIWHLNNNFELPSKIIFAGQSSVFTRSCLVISEKNLVLCGTRDGDIQLWDLLTIHPKDRYNYYDRGLIYYTVPYFQTDFSSTDYDTFYSTIHTSPIAKLAIPPCSIDGKLNQRNSSTNSNLLIASFDEADIMIIWSLVYDHRVYDRRNKYKPWQQQDKFEKSMPGHKLIKLRRIERGEDKSNASSTLLTSLHNSYVANTSLKDSNFFLSDGSNDLSFSSCLGLYFFPLGEANIYGSNAADVHYLVAKKNGNLEHRSLYADSIFPKKYIVSDSTENIQDINSTVRDVQFSPFLDDLFLVCLENYSVLLFHERCCRPMLSWDLSFHFFHKYLSLSCSFSCFTSVQWSLIYPAVLFIMIHREIFVIDLTSDRTEPVYNHSIDDENNQQAINYNSDFLLFEKEMNVNIIVTDTMGEKMMEQEFDFRFADDRKEMMQDEVGFLRDLFK